MAKRNMLTRSEAPGQSAGPGRATLDLRELADYIDRHGLVVVGSTVTDNGKCRLIVELKTRKERGQ